MTLTLRAYREFFDSLPAPVRQLVNDRWGAPRRDPFYLTASDEFALPAFHCGNVVIGLQPAVVHGHQIVSVERRHGWLRERYPDVRVVVYGHTHRRCIDRSARPWIVNPGAAGRNRAFARRDRRRRFPLAAAHGALRAHHAASSTVAVG